MVDREWLVFSTFSCATSRLVIPVFVIYFFYPQIQSKIKYQKIILSYSSTSIKAIKNGIIRKNKLGPMYLTQYTFSLCDVCLRGCEDRDSLTSLVVIKFLFLFWWFHHRASVSQLTTQRLLPKWFLLFLFPFFECFFSPCFFSKL